VVWPTFKSGIVPRLVFHQGQAVAKLVLREPVLFLRSVVGDAFPAMYNELDLDGQIGLRGWTNTRPLLSLLGVASPLAVSGRTCRPWSARATLLAR